MSLSTTNSWTLSLALLAKSGRIHARSLSIVLDIGLYHPLTPDPLIYFTHPIFHKIQAGQTVVLGSYGDTINKNCPVQVPLDQFQGSFTTLVRKEDA